MDVFTNCPRCGSADESVVHFVFECSSLSMFGEDQTWASILTQATRLMWQSGCLIGFKQAPP